MQYYAFAMDSVAVVSTSLAAPGTISQADLLKVYNCTFTDWSQLPGGGSGPIQRYIPQAGSGTRTLLHLRPARRLRPDHGQQRQLPGREPELRGEPGHPGARRRPREGDPSLLDRSVDLPGQQPPQPVDRPAQRRQADRSDHDRCRHQRQHRPLEHHRRPVREQRRHHGGHPGERGQRHAEQPRRPTTTASATCSTCSTPCRPTTAPLAAWSASTTWPPAPRAPCAATRSARRSCRSASPRCPPPVVERRTSPVRPAGSTRRPSQHACTSRPEQRPAAPVDVGVGGDRCTVPTHLHPRPFYPNRSDRPVRARTPICTNPKENTLSTKELGRRRKAMTMFAAATTLLVVRRPPAPRHLRLGRHADAPADHRDGDHPDDRPGRRVHRPLPRRCRRQRRRQHLRCRGSHLPAGRRHPELGRLRADDRWHLRHHPAVGRHAELRLDRHRAAEPGGGPRLQGGRRHVGPLRRRQRRRPADLRPGQPLHHLAQDAGPGRRRSGGPGLPALRHQLRRSGHRPWRSDRSGRHPGQRLGVAVVDRSGQ